MDEVVPIFDDAESNGDKILGIKILLGVANRRRNFGFLAKTMKICQFLRTLQPLIDTGNRGKNRKKRFSFDVFFGYILENHAMTPAPCTPNVLDVPMPMLYYHIIFGLWFQRRAG